ncbi:MAG TPA: NAD(P)/FAD-dependent oxidoreductase, partial [Cytophagaceae bacterium]|nr:NAD(P)/FAD-dependent oxidoreductase [Cytophagaceae bacterium]
MENRKTIVIAGAGLVGSLLSIFLAKKGHRVKVVEKRPDPRINLHREGRSINLALSYRGLKALEAADPNLPTAILSQAVPMYGRQMHDEQGRLSFQPYSNNNECIYSVSRAYLNNCLISQAEKEGVSFLFEHSIEETHFASKTLHVLHKENSLTIDAPVLFAADGVFSKIRGSLEKQGLCQSHIERIDHGYKELDIPADKGLLVEPFTALHIWPRGEYMLIALPNFDGSYTGTLFFPYKKEDHSFEKLDNEQSITDFFRTHFADAYPLLTNLYHQYTSNPISYLSNVYSNQWSFEEWLLVGDAAHGIVPFYGQGMNAGFEDCRLLMELLTSQHNDWS